MAHEDRRHAAWRSEFESLGEEAVRMIDSGSQAVPDDRIRFSRIWLKEQEGSRIAAALAKQDAREEETLSLARKALRSSYWANAVAIVAAIIALIAILIGKASS
jgi:hypothetical protein